jgi:hypothetical protein
MTITRLDVLRKLKESLDRDEFSKARVTLSKLERSDIEEHWIDVGNAYYVLYAKEHDAKARQKAIDIFVLGLLSPYNFELKIPDDSVFNDVIKKLTNSWEDICDRSLLRELAQRPSSFFPKPAIDTVNKWLKRKWGKNFLSKNRLELQPVIKDILAQEYGAENVVEILAAFEKLEEIFYSVNPLYRDHIVHSFRVYILGLYVLKRIWQLDRDYFRNTFDRLNQRRDISIYSLIWFLASVFHDIAYPIQELNRLNESIEGFFLSFFGFQYKRAGIRPEQRWIHAVQDFLPLLERTKDSEKNIAIHRSLLEGLSTLDHGVLSALMMMNSIVDDVVRKAEDPDEYFEEHFSKHVAQSAQAIALHNLEYVVSIEKAPMVFLLALCDELQEWDRSLRPYGWAAMEGIKLHIHKEKGFDISALIDFRACQTYLEKSGWSLEKALESKKKLAKLQGRNLGGTVYVLAKERVEEGKVTINSVCKIPFGNRTERPVVLPIIACF